MSDHPKRILDDEGAPESLRDALKLSSESPASDYDSTNGLSRFRAAIIAAPVTGDAGAPDPGLPDPSAPAQLAQAAGQSATWWGLAAVGTAGAILAFVALGPAFSGSEEPVTETTETVDAPESEEATPHMDGERTPTVPPADPTAADPLPLPEVDIAETEAPPSAPSPSPRRADTTSGDDALRREIAQLAEARRLLSDNPARALTLVRTSQREFRDGMFGEERAALEIFALVSLGRVPEAQRRGRRFLRRYEHGPFTERVRQVLD